jgi:hypothetical protein
MESVGYVIVRVWAAFGFMVNEFFHVFLYEMVADITEFGLDLPWQK